MKPFNSAVRVAVNIEESLCFSGASFEWELKFVLFCGFNAAFKTFVNVQKEKNVEEPWTPSFTR